MKKVFRNCVGVALTVALSAACLFLSSAPAGATTYVLMSDEALARQAPIIAEVEIVDVLANSGTMPPTTEFHAVVRRVVKGDVEQSTMVLRVAGGRGLDGKELFIPGLPSYRSGDRALVFLVPNADGSYGILHGLLGTFEIVEEGDRKLAVRDLSEANLVSAPEQEDLLLVRDFEGFAAWLEDHARGFSREPDYFVPLGSDSFSAAWKLFKYQGKHLRWFKFDTGEKVKFRFRSAGSMGLRAQFKKALKVWNADERTVIRFKFSRTRSRVGHQRSDGKCAIIFDDPNDLMPGAFDCVDGGVIAMGGPWFDTSGTRSFNGEDYYRIGEADIVVNDGVECLFSGNPTAAAETFAHELGHTLGIDHSRNKRALMYPILHNDERGASLSPDDRRAIKGLYKPVASGGGGTGFNAPSNLEGWSTSSTEGTLIWRDNSSNETEFRVSYRRGSGGWVHWASVPANATRLDFKGASPGVTYSFIVHAYKGQTPSAGSNIIKVTMPGGGGGGGGGGSGFNAPTNLEGWATSSTTGVLTWNDNSSNETEFRISYRFGSGSWIHWAKAPANTTRFEFWGATPGATYSFIVHAYKGSTASAGSNIVKVTMPSGGGGGWWLRLQCAHQPRGMGDIIDHGSFDLE